MANVLIVDNDINICKMMSTKIRFMGHNIQYAMTLYEGTRKTCYGSGLQGLTKIKEVAPDAEAIVVTGTSRYDDAELAISNGSWDYIEKPSTINLMINHLLKILKYKESHFSDRVNFSIKRDGIIGKSAAINASLRETVQAVKTDTNVFINGETGTGKELFA
jgi:two-component system NtrC family response regulator